MPLRTVTYTDLGLISYQEAWALQEKLFKGVVDEKVRRRKENEEGASPVLPNYLLFCEHPHVYTLGKSGDASNLLLNQQELADKNAEYVKINRGGDITYHGPGQIVGYPILDLDQFFTDIHKYLRYLEEAVILTLAEYGMTGGRVDGLTGVWLDGEDPQKARKICALGVRSSRWVTMHGFAFNVHPDLSYFNHIIPCGITDKAVTSMAIELGTEPNIAEVKEKLKFHLSNLFEMKVITKSVRQLQETGVIHANVP